jgi:MFS family permease
MSEVAPNAIRGQIMSLWQLSFGLGAFFAYWINYSSAQKPYLEHWTWRLVVVCQVIIPVLLLVQLPFIPESPRWFINKGSRVEEARASLRCIRDTEEEIEEELTAIRDAVKYEREALYHGKKAYLALWKDLSLRRRMLIVLVLNVGQQLCGQGTLASFSSTVYSKVWKDTGTINLINALNATFSILFTANAIWTVDRWGRRMLLFVGAVGMSVCMLIVALVGLLTPDINGAKTEPVGIAIVFLLFMFAVFYKPSWGATVWIYTAEVFSMNVRAQAVGMSAQMQNVANTIFQQFFPTFYANEGL